MAYPKSGSDYQHKEGRTMLLLRLTDTLTEAREQKLALGLRPVFVL